MLISALKQALLQVDEILGIFVNMPPSLRQQHYCEHRCGSHIRHIQDHFLALKNGLGAGVVDYNQRNRNAITESDPLIAIDLNNSLLIWADTIPQQDINLLIISEVDFLQTINDEFRSGLRRECLYLINHTIHHLAHIRLMLSQYNIDVPSWIGIAPSTASWLRNAESY